MIWVLRLARFNGVVEKLVRYNTLGASSIKYASFLIARWLIFELSNVMITDS